VKGADWKDKGVVGEDLVKAYGGKVKLIELLPGISTSIMIENILRSHS
jgi:bifunctional ADP-heptose synthase (sugar kinase/adenylyltransferase)